MNHNEKNFRYEGFYCKSCDKHFSQKNRILIHNHKYHEDLSIKILKCSKCNSEQLNEKALKIHMARYHNKKAIYNCPHCDRRLANKHSVPKHILIVHTPKEQWPYSCDLCTQKFTTYSDKSKHLLSKVHIKDDIPKVGTQEWKKLLFGEELFFKKEEMELSAISGDKKNGDKASITFDCNNCTMKFHEDKLLKMHISQIHNENLIYKCDKCGAVFASQSSLTKHVKRIHTSNKIWTIECKECEKKFPDKATLSRHLATKIHIEKKDLPIICKLCSHRFTRRYYLKRHLLSNVHKNVPKSDSKEFHDLLYADIKTIEGKTEEINTEDQEVNFSEIKQNDIVVEGLMNSMDTIKQYSQPSPDASKSLVSTKIKKLTPLEALVLRLDNNEKISSDEMLDYISLICNS